MKRVITLGLALSCLLFLQACCPECETPEPQTEVSQPDRATWVEVEEGVSVVRLWDEPDEYPQIAVLRLSDERHAQFQDNPMVFLNERKIFSPNVENWDGLCSQDATIPSESENTWDVVAIHKKTSTARAASLRE